MDQQQVGMFTAVDLAPGPGFLVDMMDRTTGSSGIQALRDLAMHALGPRPGQLILDLGCGPGDETGAIAARVAPGGEVVGVDLSQAMVDAAGRRLAASGLH